MPPRKLLLLLLAAPAGAAASETRCSDVPLCVRIAAAPARIFFVGEAVAERHRDGRHPEYRFAVRQALYGLAGNTEFVAVETSEGRPPEGWLLIEARATGEAGVYSRAECDFFEPESTAAGALDFFRNLPAADASLTVAAAPGHRVLAEGPLTRWADARGKFPGLPAGTYRVTVVGGGSPSQPLTVQLPSGGCVEISLLPAP